MVGMSAAGLFLPVLHEQRLNLPPELFRGFTLLNNLLFPNQPVKRCGTGARAIAVIPVLKNS